jgi:hypothetical protein
VGREPSTLKKNIEIDIFMNIHGVGREVKNGIREVA